MKGFLFKPQLWSDLRHYDRRTFAADAMLSALP